ncbi:AaceriAFR212Wp [[Ashbya] aceris (nom. inval.)]|nr:AaceriAFR212Wp [[Ashbya] aceris (nom. inval.)]
MNSSVLERLEYLNQSSHFLVSDSTPLASLVNTPYRIYKAFYDAVVTQYLASLNNPEMLPFNSETFMSSVGYFFSSYAVGCFFIAVILSRLSAMAGLRSNTVRTSIPNWSRVTLHTVAIVALVYGLCGVAVQYRLGWLGRWPAQDVGTFLSRTYVVFTLSHCIETFLAITTNGKPLEESDYTIFELSAQFYGMTKGRATAHEYGPDCIMALSGRLIIHLVELFRKRRWRLVCSTLLNTGFISYLLLEVRSHGLASLSLFTKCKHFPKFFSVFIIGISMACYLLACLVRFNPAREEGTSAIDDLQFHSFVSNWFKNLNLTGEEEFSITVMRLAVLLCNPSQNKEHGLHRELPHLKTATSLHKSYMISGYMNKLSKIPESVAGSRAEPSPKPRSVAIRRVLWLGSILAGICKRIRSSFSPPKPAPPVRNTHQKTANFNDYINENNYTHFMTMENDETFSPLLPEEDGSADYENDSLDENDDVCDSDLDVEEPQDILQEVVSPQTMLELARSSPQDLTWYLSMWTILNCESAPGKRLTRSQYAHINETGILKEVLLQRNMETRTSASKIQDEDADMSCVVCKTNLRNIVLWPCRCFALCEECRVSLGLRGFKACVCCRADVHGYSRLNAV